MAAVCEIPLSRQNEKDVIPDKASVCDRDIDEGGLMLKRGTKSVLFGVHQFIWHPITVLIAWWKLYGRPSWKELICIFVHDLGYWGSPNMDGEEGERHPELGADIAKKLFGPDYYFLCLYHSRHYARTAGAEPSKLCWADKLSIFYEPWWFYIFRALLSGEIHEYRELAVGYIPLRASHRTWFEWIKERFSVLAIKKRADAVPYANPERTSE